MSTKTLPRKKKADPAKQPAEPAIGVYVRYCGHDGYFLADIWRIGNVNVVRAAKVPVTPANILRWPNADGIRPTHAILDFPEQGFWRPDLGIFVLPAGQCYRLPAGEQ